MFITRLFCAVVACLVAVSSAKDAHIQTRIRSGEIVSRAVNLGGWLMSEYWMCYTSPLYKGITPELGITGEYAIMKKLGKEVGTKQFEEHWSTWITEDDIAEIAKTGMNTVRVSTGYWIINDEDDSDTSEVAQTYAKGGLKYLDKLINVWAVKYNLAVMLSLHAHKGSQNGLDHTAPVEMFKVGWSLSPDNAKSSFNYATFLANRYKKSEAFLGLNLMNEPTQGVDYGMLEQYYRDAYKAIREDGNDCILGTSPWLQDQGPPKMMDFLTCPENYNVWHEFHVYYKWGWKDVPLPAVFAEAGTYASTHYASWTGNPVFLGEWSLATWEETLTDEQLTQFAEIQMAEAEKSPAGWAFWAWRHDDETKMTSPWSMRQLLRKGIITMPKTDPSRVGTRNPSCPVVPPSNYSSSGSSESGSGDSGVGSVVLPGTVAPVDPETNTSPSVTPETTKSGAAAGCQKVGATLLVGVSTLLALTL